MHPMENQLKTEMAVLQEISYAVVHERNVNALLDKVLDILNRQMGMLRGTFTLRQGDSFVIEASLGLDESEKKRGRYKLGEGVTGEVAATGKPALVSDIALDKRFLDRTGARRQERNIAFLCVPIVHLEKVVGTLSIDRKVTPDADLDADLQLLEIVANVTAEAVAACREAHKEHEHLVDENRRLREALGGSTGNPGHLVGNCRTMQHIYELIRQVAPSSATVLIRGGSGTGKELVAGAIRIRHAELRGAAGESGRE